MVGVASGESPAARRVALCARPLGSACAAIRLPGAVGTQRYGGSVRAWREPQAAFGYRKRPFGDFSDDGHPSRQGVRRRSGNLVRLQATYELAQAMQKAGTIKVRRRVPAA